MITLSKLRTQAIAAAKNNNWTAAIDANESILNETPSDISALNRLGLAYMQLGETKKAKDSFKKALEIDKTNNIAKKQLDRIASKQNSPIPSFNREHFIEEPGKTKIVELRRLAGKQVLDQLSVGKTCKLVPKKRFISVENEDGTYIGSLPEDISFRITKLIESGNTYSCRVHTTTNNQCAVYLKELTRSKRNEDIHSFPSMKTTGGQMADMDDRFLLEDDDIPVQTVDHDSDDNGKSIDDLEPEDIDDED